MFAKLPRVTCTVFLARFLPRRLEARSKTTHFHTRTSAHKPLSTTMDYPCTRIHVAKLRLFHQHLVYTWQATSFHGDWQSFDALCLSLLLCYWGLLMCFRLLSSEVVVALMVLSVFDSMNLNCVKITDTWTCVRWRLCSHRSRRMNSGCIEMPKNWCSQVVACMFTCFSNRACQKDTCFLWIWYSR